MVYENMSTEELEAEIAKIQAIIESRKETCTVEFETCDAFDKRKHGGSYVAFLSRDEDGKISRQFVGDNGKMWDGRYYKTSYTFEAKEGDVLECRLDDGSWKNDYREYFQVVGGKPVSVTQKHAFNLIG